MVVFGEVLGEKDGKCVSMVRSSPVTEQPLTAVLGKAACALDLHRTGKLTGLYLFLP